MAILSKGEIFGEEDIISNNTRQYTAKCYSMEGEVYLISKKDFMNRFAFLKDNKEKSLFESFKLHSLNKIEIYSQKINQFSNIITNNRSFIIGSFQTKLNHIQYKEQEKIQTNKYKTNKYVINDFNDAEKYINKKTLISTKINGFFNENQENSIFPVSNPNKKHRKLRPASNLIQNTKNKSQTPSKRFFKYLDLQLSLTPKSRNNGLDGLLRNLFKK